MSPIRWLTRRNPFNGKDHPVAYMVVRALRADDRTKADCSLGMMREAIKDALVANDYEADDGFEAATSGVIAYLVEQNVITNSGAPANVPRRRSR